MKINDRVIIFPRDGKYSIRIYDSTDPQLYYEAVITANEAWIIVDLIADVEADRKTRKQE